MTRPKISAAFFSQLVEQSPGRVRKRLDSSPGIANQWVWTSESQEWEIRTGEETVRLHPGNQAEGSLSRLDEVTCSCLLSPRCFHVLACCSVLEILTQPGEGREDSVIGVAPPDGEADGDLAGTPGVLSGHSAEKRVTEVADGTRAVARSAVESLEQLLRIGARNSGLLLQTDLLRVSHLCRASGVVTLSNALVSIVEGIRRIRAQSDEADAVTLRNDLVQALWLALCVCRMNPIPAGMLGQLRRSYAEVEVRKVQGVLAEPVLTRSGFAGVSVLLQDVHQGGLYSINEIRPGDSNLVQQAYLGGIELGGVMAEARALCRGTYSVQGLMASSDGRLSKGKNGKWGRAKPLVGEERSRGQFNMSLSAQISTLRRWLEVASDLRPPGWDLLEVTGLILGARGGSLVVALDDGAGIWRFDMPLDAPQLEYRHNFRVLAQCAPMRLRWYIRLKLEATRVGAALAVRNDAGPFPGHELEGVRLDLPEDWNGVANLGLDRLERHFAIGIQSTAEVPWGQEAAVLPEDSSKFVQSIERRLIGITLGGLESVPALGSKTLQRDCGQLRRLGLACGAGLLEQLSKQAHAEEEASAMKRRKRDDGGCDAGLDVAPAFLACAKYIEAFQHSLAIDPHLESLTEQLEHPGK